MRKNYSSNADLSPPDDDSAEDAADKAQADFAVFVWTDRRRRFVTEYTVDLCATQAAIRAGFNPNSAKGTAHRLMHHPVIREEIQMALDARAARLRITSDMVLRELARIAFHDPRRIFREDDSPQAIRALGDREASAISSVEVIEQADGSRVRKVRFADRVAALDRLARHLGLFDKDNARTIKADSLTSLLLSVQGTAIRPAAKLHEGD